MLSKYIGGEYLILKETAAGEIFISELFSIWRRN